MKGAFIKLLVGLFTIICLPIAIVFFPLLIIYFIGEGMYAAITGEETDESSGAPIEW